MKITKKELQRAIQRQESRIDGLVGLLAKKGYYDKEPEPQLKQLSQSVFDGAEPKYITAATNEDGRAFLFPVPKSELEHALDCWFSDYRGDSPRVDGIFDASNWQNSLITREPGPLLKQLDQSAFDHPYATGRFKYAALNADGQAVFFESKPVISNCLDIWVVHTGSVMPMLKGYDASNWQNSLIERDTAKEPAEVDLSIELTGSELCKAMLARGDTRIMCKVFDVDRQNDITHVIRAYSEGKFHTKANRWTYAIPINNQGEPLTASEVGL